MSAAPKIPSPETPARRIDREGLLDTLTRKLAVILEDGPPPWRAVPRGDTRCRPIAWIDAATLKAWRMDGKVRRHRKGWEVRPGPRPLLAPTPDGPTPVEVRECWMQRLARDLDLEGPLAEAGLRLVADGLRREAASFRQGARDGVVVDGRPRTNAEEARTLRRLDARRRVRDALAHLQPLERAVAEGVCLADRSLEEIAHLQSTDEARITRAFRHALLELSLFYGTLPGLRPRR